MEEAQRTPRRCDPIVKLVHWGVVPGVIGNASICQFIEDLQADQNAGS